MRQTSHLAARRLLALSLATVIVLASCSGGGDDDAGDGETSSTAAATTEAAADPGEAVRVTTLDAPDAPGPEEYDEVRVIEHGDPEAENVLVLAPGTSAGAGYFSPLAQEIVRQLPDWQVWAVDRRENLIEDHTLIDAYLAGDATAQEAFDYYLGWLSDPSIEDHFEAPSDEDLAFTREWGMEVAIDDLQVVVEEAASRGGKVVLGGHSLGGSITVAYASWDFDGTPGVEDLSGLVLIDGGTAQGTAPTPEEAQVELADLQGASPFNDLVGLGLPWAAGVFNSLGATAVLREPDEPSLAYDFDLFPEDLKPPVAPTNAGQYGFALDEETSPDSLALVHLDLGHLAESGEPRGWVSDELVPVERAAAMFSGDEGVDGTEWYFPSRLSLDSDAVNGGVANPAQEVLGVRATHGTELDVPIFALETSFGEGRVIPAARSVAEQSGLDEDQVTAVEAHDLTHTDPMGAVPEQNPLLEGLVPYLSQLP